MKKLSLLISLILCVTIGGVYATWTYAGNDVADAEYESVIRLTDANITGSQGVYSVESNLKLMINQKADGDYTAVLEFTTVDPADTRAPFLKITFTPDEKKASDNTKANGIPSELYFTTTSTMQIKVKEGTGDNAGKFYVDETNGTLTDIVKLTNPANSVLNPNITWTKQDNGSFTYEMDLDALKGQISLNKNFYLDTKDAYDKFHNALNGNIVARVTDGTVTSSTSD